MSGPDLISRMDAIQACQIGPSDEWSKATKSGYSQAATDCALNILRIEAAIDPAAIREAAMEIWKLANSRDPDDPVFVSAILSLIDKKGTKA